MIDALVLGRYRLLRRLASGGMGAVYLARTEGAEGFARPVVVKRVLPGLTEDREITQLFVREARILSNLHHPNIVQVLDFGQWEDESYLMVLEYVHGYPLADWQTYVREARGPMPVEFAVYITCKILDALHYAHTFQRADGRAMPIIHRDVTPSNVLLSDQGSIKLADFGIARMQGDEGDFSTDHAQVRGKLPYLPVEVFRGVEPSISSDVYSTGVTLYELLVGRNPFDGQQQAEVYRKIVELEPRPVDELRDDVSTELAAVVWRAMHKDLTLRFATAVDFANALRGVLRRSQDEVGRTLAAQIREDFLGDLPAQMALESLGARELAWRVARSKPLSPAPGARSQAEAEEREPPLATVRMDVAPELLARAASSNAPPRAGATRTALPRVIAAAALSAIIGAVAALGAWITIAHEAPVPERMLVIQRESPVRAPVAEAQAPSTPPGRAPESALSASAPERAQQGPASLPPTAAPDARQLSRVFGRKQQLLQSCFLRHAAGMKDVPQVVIHFRVGSAGAVEEASLSPQELGAQPLGLCLLQIARGTRFGPLSRAVSFHIPLSAQKVDSSSL